ncbi:MAG: AAA family ATPase, partial [Adlercreutzia sp.]|nr:AAA family ATPase [Adlercreutzia sp.]
MLKRKIEKRIESWKATKTNKGLLITGARQTGKTSSIEAFGRERYEAMVKIDFVEQPRAVEVISEAQNLSDLIMRITALAERPLAPESTLLFFDEVQRCADAITWMRYLAEDDRFDVIYSGSMLGVEAYDFRSLPVGTIDIEEMFPLDFEEFCWSQGTDPALWDAVKGCFAAREPVPDFLHEMFLDLWL